MYVVTQGKKLKYNVNSKKQATRLHAAQEFKYVKCHGRLRAPKF